MESSLPSVDEIVTERSIMMERYIIDDLPSAVLKLAIESSTDRKRFTPITGRVFKLDPSIHQGYIPSKVWLNNGKNVEILIYRSELLPPHSRPFGNLDAYAVRFPVATNVVVRYPADATMFIDQFIDGDLTWYFMMFDENQYGKLVLERWSDK